MSEEAELAIKLIPAVAAVGAGLLAVLRWIDLRRREVANDEFEKLFRLIMIVTGHHPNGSEARMVDQIAAIWMLKKFSRHHDIISKAFDRDWKAIGATPLFVEQVAPEIEKMLKEMKVDAD